jgi:hypothetical protein
MKQPLRKAVVPADTLSAVAQDERGLSKLSGPRLLLSSGGSDRLVVLGRRARSSGHENAAWRLLAGGRSY